MLQTENLIAAWKEAFQKINDDIFGFQVIKPDVGKWIEENVFIPESTSVRPGPYSFEFTPYMRRPCQLLHPKDPARFVTIMKDGQSGFTTALVIGGMLYIIAICPDGILFTAADVNLSTKTIEERFDPVVRGPTSSKKPITAPVIPVKRRSMQAVL
jgi:phage terminase large subunit GpA-like protein